MQKTDTETPKYLWFGDHAPEYIEAECLLCENFLSVSMEKVKLVGKDFVFPQICPECKRRALKFKHPEIMQYVKHGLWDYECFLDQYNVPYMLHIKTGENFQIGGTTCEYHFRAKNVLESEKSLSMFFSFCKSLATYGKIKRNLSYRYMRDMSGIYVDTQKNHIKIHKQGWEVIPPVNFFRRHGHMYDMNVENGGKEDFDRYLSLFNFKTEDDKTLFVIWLITCLDPNISHPIAMPFGAQGAAKSTMGKLAKKLIDPSALTIVSIPNDPNEFMLQLSGNYMIVYDNLTTITTAQADILCRATTGQSFSKRMLFTDSDEFIRSYRTILILNGINLPSTRPDLLDRMLLLEVDRIPEDKRRMEEEIDLIAEEHAAKARGYMFDIMSSARSIIPEVVMEMNGKMPRMADWAVMAESISRCLGYPKWHFLALYKDNARERTEQAVEGDVVAPLLIEIAEESFDGTASELYQLIVEKYEGKSSSGGAERRIATNPHFPRSVIAFSRKLRELQTTLVEKGYVMQFIHDGRKRKIIIRKKEEKGQQILG